MIKKYISFALICLLLITVNSSLISAQITTDKDLSSAVKIKEKIAKRGTGKNKRIEVKMQNGTKLKGYISQAGEDSFTLVDSKTTQSSVIAYSEIAKIKNRLSKGDKIALGIVTAGVATAAIVLISIYTTICRNEGNC